MLKLPVYLRGHTYYFHTRISGVQFKRSLGTSDPLTAKLRAIEFLRVIDMHKPKLEDFKFEGVDPSKYEIDLSRGIANATDPEDHKRLMQALKLMAKAAQGPQPTAVVEPLKVAAPTEGALTLPELVGKFFTLKSTLSDATKTDYTATANELDEYLKSPGLVDIGEDNITSYMEFLAARGNTPRTIDKKVGAVRALFNFAKKQKLFKGENPAADRNLLTRKQKNAAGSKAFDLADIQTLFGNEQFAEYKAKEPAFYWIATAGLITGVRVSALAAITKASFKISPAGTHYIYIDSDKTEAGKRPVPLPKGFFVPFFEFIKSSGGFGFKVRPDGKGASDPVRKLLDAHKSAIGYEGGKQTFHSLRKTFNTYLQHSKVPLEARCQIIGHELDHVNVQVYGEEYSLEELAGMVVPCQQELLKIIKF
ncbi:phage integrase SAM-like domain-containing protein [Variovorax sp. ZT5P49]|uniref:phage integrase SAM-like domain-containing protein n=1 Tax=Variovorax sp. ZT5P49 TaxID=3443733 RepID=UPI003F465356